MKEPNWDTAYSRLLEESREAIARFRIEHPEVTVSDFWFDSEPRYGYVMIALNSEDSAIRFAKEQYDYHVAYRRKLFTEQLKTWLDCAIFQLSVHSVSQVCTNSGDFDFPDFAEVLFPEWQEFAESDDYPQSEDSDRDFLKCRVGYTFWRVLEQLVAEDAFRDLHLASPTRVGFAFHDGPELTQYLINWKN